MAALSGENIWVGVASGAVSGAIAGAALDIAIATGGTGLVAIAAYIGINTAGGALGAAAGEVISQLGNQYANGESLNVNWNDVGNSAAWGGAFGLITGAASVGKVMQMRNTQKLVNGIIDNPSYWNNPNGYMDSIEKVGWQDELWGNLYPQLNKSSIEVYKGVLPSVRNGLLGFTQPFFDEIS